MNENKPQKPIIHDLSERINKPSKPSKPFWEGLEEIGLNNLYKT